METGLIYAVSIVGALALVEAAGDPNGALEQDPSLECAACWSARAPDVSGATSLKSTAVRENPSRGRSVPASAPIPSRRSPESVDRWVAGEAMLSVFRPRSDVEHVDE